jgi:hypothetical protein
MNAPAATIAAAALAACGACNARVPLDDLADGVLVLPPALREVSGITAVDAHTIACVQDEAGALFFVATDGREQPRMAPFGARGDYEGLARVGGDYWLLRSDGLLQCLRPGDGGLVVAAHLRMPREHGDYEGLCHDGRHGLLLVLPKDKPEGDKDARDRRPVYAVDLAAMRVLPEPQLVYRVRDLVDQARARGFDLPTRTNAKGKERVHLRVLASEILVDTAADDVLILSAIDRALFRLDREGRLRSLRLFDEAELPQPEAMTMLPDGRLLVASEGAGGTGAIIRVVPRD